MKLFDRINKRFNWNLKWAMPFLLLLSFLAIGATVEWLQVDTTSRRCDQAVKFYGDIGFNFGSVQSADLFYNDDSGKLYRLIKGSANQILKVNSGGTSIGYETGTPSMVGLGNVTNNAQVISPASNTADYIPQWNGANSKTLKDGLTVGTSANNLIQLNGDAKLPAVDGSLLTNLSNPNAVLLVGNQTVNDVKTFTSFPITPSSTPTTSYQVANKDYVDAKINFQTLNVKNFGAVGDGTADDTEAIQNAINSLTGDAGGAVYFPSGIYKITSGLTVEQHRIHIYGDGPHATQILFAPSANGIALKCDTGSNSIVQGSVKHLAFYSTDSTYTKTALEIIGGDGYVVDNIVIGGNVALIGSVFWSDSGNSIGIKTAGGQASSFRNLYIFADKAIEIGINPAASGIDCDHFHFQDCYVGAYNNPCVTVDDGVTISNLLFDGYQAWVLGTHGFYYNNTTAINSSKLKICNARTEQGQSATAYTIYINSTSTGYMQTLVLENIQTDAVRKGIFLGKVEFASLHSIIHAGTTEFLNCAGFDNGQALSLKDCFAQQGSSVTLTDMIQVSGIKDRSIYPIDGTSNWVSASYSAGYYNTPFTWSRYVQQSMAASTIASSSTIAPTAAITHITGTTTINTITMPHAEMNGVMLTLIPDGAFSLGTSGNIAVAVTAVVGKAIVLIYDAVTTKWYPVM